MKKRVVLFTAVICFAVASLVGCTVSDLKFSVKELDTNEKVKDANVAPLDPTN